MADLTQARRVLLDFYRVAATESISIPIPYSGKFSLPFRGFNFRGFTRSCTVQSNLFRGVNFRGQATS